MIQGLRDMGLLWPTLFVGVAFPTLIALGNWQWSRMHWKLGLLQDLEQAARAAPAPLSDVAPATLMSPGADLKAIRFRRVIVSGVFEHQYEMHVWSPMPTGPAWSVVTPLRLQPVTLKQADQVSRQVSRIFVIRGTVPAATKLASKRHAGQISGRQTMTGRIRVDRPNKWANEPNIVKNEWFTRDLKVMAAHLQNVSGGAVQVAPFFVELEQQISNSTAPKPDLKALTLSNRHFEYAMTWWGLAATLAGVFATFVWGRRNSARV